MVYCSCGRLPGYGGRLLPEKGGDSVYLTFSDPLGFGMFVIALIALIVQIGRK